MSRAVSKCLALILVILGAASAEAATVTGTFYGQRAPDPSAEGHLHKLVVGTADVVVDEVNQVLMQSNRNLLKADFRTVYQTNQDGEKVDHLGHPADNRPEDWVVDHYVVERAWVYFEESAGVWQAQEVDLGHTGGFPQAEPPTVAPTTDPIGDVYVVTPDEAAIQRVRIRHGTPFGSAAEAAAFRAVDLWDAETGRHRLRGNQTGSLIDVGRWTVRTSGAELVPQSTLQGAIFAVEVANAEPMVWYEREADRRGEDLLDLYYLDGVVRYITDGVPGQDESTVAWRYRRGEDDIHAIGYLRDAKALAAVPEPWRSRIRDANQTHQHDVGVVITPAERNSVGGQDTENLLADFQEGVAIEGGSTVELEAAAEGTGYFSVNGDDVEVREPGQEGYQDRTLDDAAADMGMLRDELPARVQGSIAATEQVKPEMRDHQDADGVRLADAIREVEADMHGETASSLPLRGDAPPRYAEMYPAGWLPRYLDGDPIPGDGDNPRVPEPSVASTGAPSYDLDGDGDLDRFRTSDPYDNGYDQIGFEWHMPSGTFRLGSYSGGKQHDNHFAVWGLNSANDDTKDLLFVGSDGTIWVHHKSRWSGVNHHAFALKHHFQILDQEEGLYRLAARYVGRTQAQYGDREDLEPTVETVDWQTKQDTTIGGETQEVLAETGTETVYLYEQLSDPDAFTDSYFSDLEFVPRATNGKPDCPAKYVRRVTSYEVVAGVAVAQDPVTTVVYFPADFREEQLEPEPILPAVTIDNSFRWDYGPGWPNYQDGYKFPRGEVGVQINHPRVLRHYEGFPLQTVESMVLHDGFEMILRETTGDRPELLPVTEPPIPDDPAVAHNQRILHEWERGKANVHDPRNPELDTSAGPGNPNPDGFRVFDIVEGAGFYVFKGRQVNYASITEQMALIMEMWGFHMRQPQTVYTVLRVNNDPDGPLLNTVQPRPANEETLHPEHGALRAEITSSGDDRTSEARRRRELIETSYFFFSSAAGREHEVAMALRMPKNARLYCVEWDDLEATQSTFADYNVRFVHSDEEERKIKGEVITKVFGKTHFRGRMDEDGGAIQITGDEAAAELALNNPGHYAFPDEDMLYDQPACMVRNCAILDDLQYGNPRTSQWRSHWKVEFRHPMVIYYDDRQSALITAYGTNADPREWIGRWDEYEPVDEGQGVDERRIIYEGWTTQERLQAIYDALHPNEFAEAKPGDIELPDPPEFVAEPSQPEPPEGWTGGSLEEPAVLRNPGDRPELNHPVPTPPWWTYGYPDERSHDPAVIDQLAERWKREGFRYDGGLSGHAMRVRTDRVFSGFNRADSPQGMRAFTWLPEMTWPFFSTRWPKRGSWTVTGRWNVGGLHGDKFGHVMDVAFVNERGGDVNMYIEFKNDDSGKIIRKGSVIKSHGFNYSQAGSWNHWRGTHTSIPRGRSRWQMTATDGGGNGTYHFRINGQTLDNWFAGENQLHVFPYYQPGTWGDQAADRAARRYQDQVQAYLDAVDAHERALVQYEANLEAHLESVARHQEWQTRVSQYEAWLPEHEAAVVEYEEAMAAYEAQRAKRERYEAAYAEWEELTSDLRALQATWDAYAAARDDWVWLAQSRISDPGVDWEAPEPAWQGFDYWAVNLYRP